MTKLRRIKAIVTAGVLGGCCGLVVLLMTSVSGDRNRLPEMTPETFYAAQQKWSGSGIGSYDLTVVVSGRQPARYQIEIRSGQVERATRNEIPLQQARTQGTWSVPGMFTTIQSDVDNLEKHVQGTADRSTPQLLLRAEFHPDFGYPIQYRRTELRKWGNNLEASWVVQFFQVVTSEQ